MVKELMVAGVALSLPNSRANNGETTAIGANKHMVNMSLTVLVKGRSITRAIIIITLIHRPDLIILDEPFSGLDPVNTAILKKIILEEKDRGATIIFSDHVMTNVEELCDQLIMIQDGKIELNGSIQDIRQSFGKTRLYLSPEIDRSLLDEIPGIHSIEKSNQGLWRLILENEEVGQTVFNTIVNGRYISTFDQQAPTIDEIFKMKSGVVS